MIRRVIALVAIALIAVAVVRSGAVRALSPNDPAGASKIWASDPEAERARAMTAIAAAARENKGADEATLALLDDAATKAPLAIEPVIAHAIEAQLKGDTKRAEALFRVAAGRNGRALPAHYFLADLYLRTGRVGDGLREVANLARLAPAGVGAVSPYIAEFARDRRNWPMIRDTLRSQPQLAEPVLLALSQDRANAPAVLAIAGPGQVGPKARWLPTLMETMIQAGDYAKARSLWVAVAHPPIVPGELLHDAQFVDRQSPAPFNWYLSESSAGLAERTGGGLHAIFYGTQNGPLLSQLLLLRPGTYSLAMQVGGSIPDPNALQWVVRCDRPAQPIATVPLARTGSFATTFTVPSNCAAQWLELVGRAQDIGGRSDINISALKLGPRGANG